MSVGFVEAQLHRGDDDHDQLPRYIGPFPSYESAEEWLTAQGPLTGSWEYHPTYDPAGQHTTLDGAGEPGEAAAYASTPAQFAARWNTADDDTRAAILHALNLSSEQAFRCVMRNHEGVLSLTDPIRNALIAQSQRLELLSDQLAAKEPQAVSTAWVQTVFQLAHFLTGVPQALEAGHSVDWSDVIQANERAMRQAIELGLVRVPHPSERRGLVTEQQIMADVHAEADEILRRAAGGM